MRPIEWTLQRAKPAGSAGHCARLFTSGLHCERATLNIPYVIGDLIVVGIW